MWCACGTAPAPNLQLVGYAAASTGGTILVCSEMSSSVDLRFYNSFICVNAQSTHNRGLAAEAHSMY